MKIIFIIRVSDDQREENFEIMPHKKNFYLIFCCTSLQGLCSL